MTQELKRTIGLWGAVWMGLGSILGTGVFVSLGIAAGVSTGIVSAVIFAAILATANGLSSAQLAAAHPVSGGTYAYGHRFLGPSFGFVAGWLFLVAKSASAATAALGCSAYLLNLIGAEAGLRTHLSLGLIAALTIASLVGMNRTTFINSLIVFVTLVSLTAFVVFGLTGGEWVNRSSELFVPDTLPNWLEATALCFVAFTGYGRIATLGEEVVDPRKTIPRAVLATLAIAALLYVGVTAVSVSQVGIAEYATLSLGGAALPTIAKGFSIPPLSYLLALGAITAMLGVLLNLILGLSRVLYAMSQKRDMPALFGVSSDGIPKRAVIAVSLIIAALALIGDIKLTWSFSAFAVLVYYGITNLCAIRMPRDLRLYPVWTAWFGLFICLTLAAFIDPTVIVIGLGLIAAAITLQRVFTFRRA